MARARSSSEASAVLRPGGRPTSGWLDRVPLVRVALLAIAVRVLAALLAFAANIAFPLDIKEQFTVFGSTHEFWDTFARWDSGWYVGIARDGYKFVEGGRSNLAFFPAYPISMRYAGYLLGGRSEHFFLGGILVSWTSFVVAMMLLYRLARLDLDEDGADRAVIYAAIFPSAYFFGLVYSESAFLCLMLGTVYAIRTKRWAVAGVVGALAMCSRVNAIMAMPALAWLAWRAADRDREQLVSAGLALTGIGLGFVAWCGYVYLLSGNPIEWAASITRWNYHPGGTPPWAPLFGLVEALWTRPYHYLTTEHQALYDTYNGFVAIVVALSTPYVWWRLGAGYGLFMAANLALPLSTGQFEGLGRYCSVLFPFALGLAAVVRSATVHHLILATFATLFMLGLSLFATVHPLF
jgi:hypothetical protein